MKKASVRERVRAKAWIGGREDGVVWMGIDWGWGWGVVQLELESRNVGRRPGIKGVGHGNGSSGDGVDLHIECNERLTSVQIFTLV